MNDLQAAKERLRKGNLALVFVKNSNSLYETNIGGLGGFLKAINDLGDNLNKASVADKVVGKAAALLCVYSQVKSAYAITLSEGGFLVLKNKGMQFNYENLIPVVLNARKTEQCPFEKLVEDMSDPKAAYFEIREFYNKLMGSSTKLDT